MCKIGSVNCPQHASCYMFNVHLMCIKFVLEYSVSTFLHFIGQLQVSKSHIDLLEKSGSLYIETYNFYKSVLSGYS